MIASAIVACAALPVQADSAPEGYVLLWSDEFDGTELDRDIWNIEINDTGCGNHELQYYIDSPSTVSVADGCLSLTACRRELDGHSFVSGRINTHGKFTFTYGIVEASIKLPQTADGLWPAFWMMGDDIATGGWPFCGETDILEMGHADGIGAGTQDRLFNGALHWGPDRDSHFQKVGDRTAPYSLQDGKFHRFRTVWTPEAISMYVDDMAEPYLTVDITDSSMPESPGRYFHKPAFILLNLAVGGDFPGIHSQEHVTALSVPDGEASMEVDYVRVYVPASDTAAYSR